MAGSLHEHEIRNLITGNILNGMAETFFPENVSRLIKPLSAPEIGATLPSLNDARSTAEISIPQQTELPEQVKNIFIEFPHLYALYVTSNETILHLYEQTCEKPPYPQDWNTEERRLYLINYHLQDIGRNLYMTAKKLNDSTEAFPTVSQSLLTENPNIDTILLERQGWYAVSIASPPHLSSPHYEYFMYISPQIIDPKHHSRDKDDEVIVVPLTKLCKIDAQYVQELSDHYLQIQAFREFLINIPFEAITNRTRRAQELQTSFDFPTTSNPFPPFMQELAKMPVNSDVVTQAYRAAVWLYEVGLNHQITTTPHKTNALLDTKIIDIVTTNLGQPKTPAEAIQKTNFLQYVLVTTYGQTYDYWERMKELYKLFFEQPTIKVYLGKRGPDIFFNENRRFTNLPLLTTNDPNTFFDNRVKDMAKEYLAVHKAELRIGVFIQAHDLTANEILTKGSQKTAYLRQQDKEIQQAYERFNTFHIFLQIIPSYQKFIEDAGEEIGDLNPKTSSDEILAILRKHLSQLTQHEDMSEWFFERPSQEIANLLDATITFKDGTTEALLLIYMLKRMGKEEYFSQALGNLRSSYQQALEAANAEINRQQLEIAITQSEALAIQEYVNRNYTRAKDNKYLILINIAFLHKKGAIDLNNSETSKAVSLLTQVREDHLSAVLGIINNSSQIQRAS